MLIRVFPRRTSFTPRGELVYIGWPPLDKPKDLPGLEVHISVTFTWDIPLAQQLQAAWSQYYAHVIMGGPAFQRPESYEPSFIPGRYVRDGVTFTTRGCYHKCSHCLVPGREGELTILSDIVPGHIIQDNNILQAGPEHFSRVIAMLRRLGRAATFSGGLEARLLTDDIIDELRGIKINELYLACDTLGSVRDLERAAAKLTLYFSRRKLRVYVLIGPEQRGSLCRLERCWSRGLLPFAQLFQPADRWIKYDADWRHLARTFSRPAAMFARHRKGE